MTPRIVELRREITTEREALGQNLALLEQQAKELVDWRTHVRRHPLVTLGAAFGGGFLIAALSAPSRRRSAAHDINHEFAEGDRPVARRVSRDLGPSLAHDTWNVVKGAVLSTAAAQLRAGLSKVLPGIEEQVDRQSRSREPRDDVRR